MSSPNRSPRRLVTTFAGTMVAACALSCEGGGGGLGSSGGAPIPFEELGQTFANKVCAAIQGCCTQNGFDASTCKNGGAKLQAAFAQTRSSSGAYDAQRAGNCVAKYAAALGSCDPKQSNFDPDRDADCKAIFSGTLGAGQPCTSRRSCQAGLTCLVTFTTNDAGVNASTGGTCAAGLTPAPGAPCVPSGESPEPDKSYAACAEGASLYCDGESKTCKTKGGAGASCATTYRGNPTTNPGACGTGTQCDSATKTCVPLRALGEECVFASLNCVPEASCDQATKKCVAKRPGGEPCPAGSGSCLHGCDTQTGKCRMNPIQRDMCAGADFD